LGLGVQTKGQIRARYQLNFFSASVLRLRWLWQEWKEEGKPWVGLGNLCSPHDRELFGASTTITIGNGTKALFWEATWLDGLQPKDVAPLTSELSKRKNIMVHKDLEEDF
jgi:hypothetical protein